MPNVPVQLRGVLLTVPRPVAAVTQARESLIQASWGVSRALASEKVLGVPSVIIESVTPVLELPGARCPMSGAS